MGSEDVPRAPSRSRLGLGRSFGQRAIGVVRTIRAASVSERGTAAVVWVAHSGGRGGASSARIPPPSGILEARRLRPDSSGPPTEQWDGGLGDSRVYLFGELCGRVRLVDESEEAAVLEPGQDVAFVIAAG